MDGHRAPRAYRTPPTGRLTVTTWHSLIEPHFQGSGIKVVELLPFLGEAKLGHEGIERLGVCGIRPVC